MTEAEQAVALAGTTALLKLLALPSKKMLRVRHGLIRHLKNRFHERPHESKANR